MNGIRLQLEHIDETIDVFFDRKISQLDHIMYKMLNPNIECEICHHVWDNISPCAPCGATRAFPTFRF